MNSDTAKSALVWNSGAWIGTQLGCTAWLLPYSAASMYADVVFGLCCLAGFVLLNVWGYSLWIRRDALPFFTAVILWLCGLTLFLLTVVVIANARGLKIANTPFGVVSTELPYWVVMLPPAMILHFILLRRLSKPPVK